MEPVALLLLSFTCAVGSAHVQEDIPALRAQDSLLEIRLSEAEAALHTALKQKSRITQDLLSQAIADTPPSLKASELARYEQIHKKMEDDKPGRPRVGFK